MTRREAREQTFFLLFEIDFHGENLQETAQNAAECRDLQVDPYTMILAEKVLGIASELDEHISTHSKKWKVERISRVARSLLRMAMGEILLEQEDVSTSVSINEAVELAKKYGGEDDRAFINGVLGAFSRRGQAPATTEG